MNRFFRLEVEEYNFLDDFLLDDFVFFIIYIICISPHDSGYCPQYMQTSVKFVVVRIMKSTCFPVGSTGPIPGSSLIATRELVICKACRLQSLHLWRWAIFLTFLAEEVEKACFRRMWDPTVLSVFALMHWWRLSSIAPIGPPRCKQLVWWSYNLSGLPFICRARRLSYQHYDREDSANNYVENTGRAFRRWDSKKRFCSMQNQTYIGQNPWWILLFDLQEKSSRMRYKSFHQKHRTMSPK